MSPGLQGAALLLAKMFKTNSRRVSVIVSTNSLKFKVSEAFSDRKFYLKHKLSTASLQSSTGKVINKIYDQRTLQKLYYESWSRI